MGWLDLKAALDDDRPNGLLPLIIQPPNANPTPTITIAQPTHHQNQNSMNG